MRSILVPIVASLVGLGAAPAHALIINGGFEAGFTGWTTVDQVGSDGTFFLQTGTATPSNFLPVPPPPEGATAAMTDAQGGGSHVIYQDFGVPTSIGPTTLNFKVFIQNLADDFHVAGNLDFSTSALNQQARADILLPGIDPFSVSAPDVLLNLYQTNPGDPMVSGYDLVSVDVTALLSAHAGSTLRLRFAEVDNVFIQNFGVDDVAFVTTQAVPEPPAVLLLLLGLAGAALTRNRRKPAN